MLQIQNNSSFLETSSSHLINYELTASQHSMGKISEKKFDSQSGFSQTLANYQSVNLSNLQRCELENISHDL